MRRVSTLDGLLPLTSAIATIVSAAAAWAAVFVVSRQVREMRRLREEQVRPFVVVRLKLGTLVSIVVENIGPVQARSIRFTFDPALSSTPTSSGEQYPAVRAIALREGIESLAPGEAFEFLLDAAHDRFSSDGQPMRIEVLVRYQKNTGGKPREYSDTYVLDLQSLAFAALPKDPQQEVKRELAKIADELKGINATARRAASDAQDRPGPAADI